MLCGMLGEYRDPGDAEVWVVNQAYKNQARPDRVYFFDSISDFDDDFVEYLNKLDCPVYARRVFRELPKSIEFPIEDVVKKMGIDYFVCSPSYMIAHAIYEGVDKLTLHGMYSVMDSLEYINHVACINFWIGRAMNKMAIVIGEGSMVAKPFPWQPGRYGYVKNMNGYISDKFMAAAYVGAINVPMNVVDVDGNESCSDIHVPRVVNT